MQTRIARRDDRERRGERDRRRQNRDDRHRQIEFDNLAWRLVVRAARAATTIVVARATRLGGLSIIVMTRLAVVMMVAVIVAAMIIVSVIGVVMRDGHSARLAGRIGIPAAAATEKDPDITAAQLQPDGDQAGQYPPCWCG